MSARADRPRRALAAAGLVLGTLLLGQLALASHVPGSIDDLFILLVYARSLVEGHGFRYQPGGASVDGFTSLLDLLYKAAALRLGPADPVRAAWAASSAAYVGVLLLAVRWGWSAARRAGAALPWAVPAALALALAPGLAEGTTYLLGTPLFALSLLAALGAAELEPGRAARELLPALAAFCVVLARPEGLLPAAVLLALRALEARRRSAARYVAPAAFCALLAGYLAWRLAVFGHWAPNSYYAKTSSARWNEVRDGLAYVAAFARTPSGFSVLVGAPLAVALALAGRWSTRAARASCARAACAGLAALFGVVVSGGDCYVGARFLAPVSVLVLAALGTAACGLRGPARGAPLVVLLASLAGELSTALPRAGAKLAALRAAPLGEDDFACERALCLQLAAALPGARVAQRDLQCLPWFAPDVEVLDTSGINAPRIAHLPEAGPVRFGRDGLWLALEEEFELLHVDFQRTRPEPWSAVPLARLLGEPAAWRRFAGRAPSSGAPADALLERYLPASVRVEACGPDRWLNVLVRSDLAPALRRAGFTVGAR